MIPSMSTQGEHQEAVRRAAAEEAGAVTPSDPIQLLSESQPRPLRHGDVVFARAGESALLLDPASGNYFSLTDVGARIWELCDGTHTIDEIAAELAEEYDAAPNTIKADARDLLEELASEGLLERG